MFPDFRSTAERDACCAAGITVWLCWIALLLLSAVKAQSDGDGGGVAPTDTNTNFLVVEVEVEVEEAERFGGGGDGGKGFGRRPGFRKGGRFGKGRKGRLQGQSGDQDATDQDAADDGEEDTSSAPSSTADVAPTASAAIPASASADSTSTPQESATGLVIPASTTADPAFEQPTSIADAFPEPQSSAATLAGIPYVAPSSTADIASLSSLFAPEQSLSSDAIPISSLPTAQLTVRTSRTVYVTASSFPLSTPLSAEEDTPAPAQATASPSPTLDLAPLPASSVKPMSAGEKAGIGIGITFAVLVIAGAIAYELYRRRNITGKASISDSPRRSLALTGFFGPTDRDKPKSDPEWSIESASKVSIMRAGSVKSVSSHSRSTTPPLPPLHPYLPSGPKLAGGTEVVKVGMTMPERKPANGLAGLALRSNPPVSPSAFPSPPDAKGREKTGSWPLPD
ncbi:hypothetical protein N0V90_009464 [Kalmusia sp. IMI 367209]|nr:hypothetical protein N0V90_009464 [Kalmusia sp. IMI 367209]